jgi:uncharacterized membrane protein YbaN (DUF454 family)
LTENFNFNAQSKKLKENKLINRMDKKFEIVSVLFESYLFMFIIVMRRWIKPSHISNMMESTAMYQERSSK